MRSSPALIVGSALCALIVGCGTKGDLYIPGVPAGTSWPYPKQTPPAQKPEKKPDDVPGSTDESK
ncbi:MAG TPA: lipoprotein [Burkholderiaceae bacterium]|nr:lipoprotein [Burkholderiaceae bacterium]